MSDSAPDSEGETITLHELLERSARAALDLQREDGSFPPGRNGVYDESETPVRTTSYWLTTLSKVYEITGGEVFAEAANDAADYLLSDEARPYGYTFHSRNVKKKNKCDGLIGQAAPIRGLAHGGVVLERPELIETAKEVFFLHPFDKQLGLWEQVEIDGTGLSFDRTLNHQLAFAAAGTELAEFNIGTTQFECFLDRLDQTMQLHSDGLIKHYVRPSPANVLQKVVRRPEYWNLLLNEAVFHYYSRSTARRKKELGYHSINLQALAHLCQAFPGHFAWESEKVQKSLIFIESEAYCGSEGISAVRHGSMVPGIHTAYALSVLTDSRMEKLRRWIEKDIENKYDFGKNLLIKNSVDSDFQSAAIYNMCFLPNIKIKVKIPAPMSNNV